MSLSLLEANPQENNKMRVIMNRESGKRGLQKMSDLELKQVKLGFVVLYKQYIKSALDFGKKVFPI